MYRGTTPTVTFTMPFNLNTMTNVWCTFRQSNGFYLEKQLSAFTQDAANKKISVKLTQNETLAMQTNALLEIQMRVKFTNNDFGASRVVQTPVYDVLNDEVLS